MIRGRKNPDEIEITYYISNNSQNKLHATEVGKHTRAPIRTTYIFFKKKKRARLHIWKKSSNFARYFRKWLFGNGLGIYIK